jgi:nucleoside-diphosphate kinase
MQRTLIIFKPDAVQRGLVGEILQRFERVGLKIVGMKMLAPDQAHYHHHYETIGTMVTRHGQKIFDITLEMIQAGPVCALVLEGVEVVAQVRKMVGPTEPKAAPPGTIRGDYAHISYSHADSLEIGITNLVHASGDPQEAEAEIAHWFKPDELHDYELPHAKFTQPKQK